MKFDFNIFKLHIWWVAWDCCNFNESLHI